MQPEYVLGHSDHELQRLARQAQLLEPITRAFLLEAGLAPGMRVLDIGSGGGDVSFLAAEIVGTDGEVVGADTSLTAVQVATANAEARGLRNVSFHHGDPTELELASDFDAVIGRYVLIFQADPALMLRKLRQRLRPDGVVVFHEPDWRYAASYPPAPTYDACCSWIVAATERARTPWASIDRMARIFRDAGLGRPAMRAQPYVAVGADASEWMHALVDIVRTLLPSITAERLATEAEIGIDTLLERLLTEATAGSPTIVGRTEVGAWSRRPG
jgi:2-polyprenyl-3-methyl-5-hydroxy-6-metoxy-1,4-benzoquinol methylase